MIELSLPEFAAQAAEFDAAVLAAAGIDAFCSSSDWILPAASSVMPERAPWLRRGAHGFAALMRWEHPSGVALLQPLEAAWELACPLVGDDPGALAAEFAADCQEHEREWDVMALSGIPGDSPLERALVEALGGRYRLRAGDRALRCRADLRGGAEAWLARRSLNFRRSLRRAEAEAERAGISIQPYDLRPASLAEAWARLLAVEAASWKGLAGNGLGVPEMRRFYELMLPRLAARGAARLQFARHEGRDVGYILGGLLGDTYRGLQFSFCHEYQRYSLGNLAQWAELKRLAAEGIATYDLGSDMEYKRRWADHLFATEALYFARRRRFASL